MPHRFAGGEGLSRETAVVIVGARNEFEGVMAEEVWSRRTHPTWRKRRQALINAGGRAFDQIGYDAQDGRHDLWFDISGFFGKM